MATPPSDENVPPDAPQPYRGRFSPYVIALMLFVGMITVSVIGAQIYIARKYSKQRALLHAPPSASSVPWIIDDTAEAGSPSPSLSPSSSPSPSPTTPLPPTPEPSR